MKKCLLSLLVLLIGIQCYAVTLVWNASSDPFVSGYHLVYGLVSKNYLNTNIVSGNTSSNYTIPSSNLLANKIYYFNICAFNNNKIEGAYAGEISWTNTVNQIPPVTNIHFK